MQTRRHPGQPLPIGRQGPLPAGCRGIRLTGGEFTLARGGPEPGYLTRLGPITPAQASYLALLAARDPATEWRVVLTDHAGRATAITRARPRRSPARPARVGPGSPRAGPASPSSLLRRVTVIISADELSTAAGSGQGTTPGPTTRTARLAAAIWVACAATTTSSNSMPGGGSTRAHPAPSPGPPPPDVLTPSNPTRKPPERQKLLKSPLLAPNLVHADG